MSRRERKAAKKIAEEGALNMSFLKAVKVKGRLSEIGAKRRRRRGR